MENPDDIVGHKTLSDGSHEPLRRDEAEAIWEHAEAERLKREADMPDELSAIKVLWSAYQRLKELGWNDAIYCPKDGSGFHAIEPGSTGIFDCHYSGEWPTGAWWCEDGGDLWPSRPCLFKLYPDDQAREDARMAEACARYSNRQLQGESEVTISIQVSVNGNYKVPVTVKRGTEEATTEIVSGRGNDGPKVMHIPYYHGSDGDVVVTVGKEEQDNG